MKLNKLAQASAYAKRFLRPSQLASNKFTGLGIQQNSKIQLNNQQNQKRSESSYYGFAFGAAGALTYALWQQQRQNNLAEESQKDEKDEFESPIKKTIDQFEIIKMLKQREQDKQQEYQDREEVDVNEMEKGVSKEDMAQMRELDRLFRFERFSKDQQDKQDAQEEEYVKDPYMRKRNGMMKHQEYRTLKVGPVDLLKNGQMIQVSVSDPFDEKKFHPTDKVLIAKHNNQYHAVGSFCGFDYTNLATGAFLGEKLICPTCGSTYNIENGFVDQGPSMRNISSFLIQQRDEKVQLVVPEHIPAFATKKYIKRAIIDPRTFVILGDTETALSAIDALRTNFTGRIVVVPSSPFGQFENLDILNKKFSPLDKSEVFMVEENFLDLANVEVAKGEIQTIDLNRNQVVVRGLKSPIQFDKLLVAWGAYKKRFNSSGGSGEYQNVYYLEDRHSHAKCHNELLKAKCVLIMGGTFEAYQTASSIREYLDSVGYLDTQIVVLDTQHSEVQQCLGFHIAGEIHQMLRDKRISVIMDTEITRIQGLNKLDMIYFKSKNPKEGDEKVEFYLKPDVVIAENGIGAPKYEISKILAPGTKSENGEPPIKLGIDPAGVPSSDTKFSLHYNDIHSPIFSAGSCTSYPSFVHKQKIRTNDTKYNIESGFYAALNMMDKRVEFRYFPFTPLKIDETPIYFVGERCQAFHEVIINGSVSDRKFVAFYVYGNEVVGFATCGYKNLHLYLWEAMKLLVMPTANLLRNDTLDYKSIVKKVLQLRPYIKCKRHDVIQIPSVMLAEFEGELDAQLDLGQKIKENIQRENEIQKRRFQDMKQKYDREGIEFIQDELELAADRDQQSRFRGNSEDGGRAYTRSGARKPGQQSSGELRLSTPNINMGADNDNQKNPLSMLINTAKKTFNG